MTISAEQRFFNDSIGYAILSQHAVTSVLTKSDRRALADHILRAEKVGTVPFALLARLLGLKLLYAAVLGDGKIDTKAAASGSRITYAIDNLETECGQLFHYDESSVEGNGIPVGSLLGATLIGMRAGTHGPLLQPNGTFRRVHLLSVVSDIV